MKVPDVRQILANRERHTYSWAGANVECEKLPGALRIYAQCKLIKFSTRARELLMVTVIMKIFLSSARQYRKHLAKRFHLKITPL